MQIFQDMNHPRLTRAGWFLPFEFNRALVYYSTIFNLSYGGISHFKHTNTEEKRSCQYKKLLSHI